MPTSKEPKCLQDIIEGVTPPREAAPDCDCRRLMQALGGIDPESINRGLQNLSPKQLEELKQRRCRVRYPRPHIVR